MDQRHTKVLCGLVDEYIKHAEPVSSASLTQSLGLDLSPASVRGILNELDQSGFIYQPHTSAGRIPTDQGYRFYVNQLKRKNIAAEASRRLAAEYQALAQTYANQLMAAANIIARMSDAYSVTGRVASRDQDVEQSGLSHMLGETESAPSDHQLATVREVSWFADHIRDYLAALADSDEQTRVYIGQENPFFDTDHTSLLTKTIARSSGGHTVITIIGPKRMAYQHNIALLEQVADLLN